MQRRRMLDSTTGFFRGIDNGSLFQTIMAVEDQLSSRLSVSKMLRI